MRKPSLKPSTSSREELQERRISDVERMLRRLPVRNVSSGAEQTATIVQQAGHALTVGSVIGHNGTIWARTGGVSVSGIVTAVISPDIFVMATSGYVTGLSGLTAGTCYESIGGTLTAYDFRPGYSGNLVLRADSTTSGTLIFEQWQGIGFKDGVYAVRTVPNTVKNGTPLIYDSGGTLALASAAVIGTAKCIGIVDSVLYAVDASNNAVAVRSSGLCAAGLDATWLASVLAAPLGTLYLSDTAGDLSTTPGTIGLAVCEKILIGGSAFIMVNPAMCTPIDWDAINDKPAAFPPSGSVSLTVDSTNTTDAAALTFSGSVGAAVWNFYEKRPRFNAKWLQGNAIKTGAPSADEQALLWNSVSSYWEPITLVANVGGLLSKDAGGLVEIDASTATSVLGRSAATAGLPAAIAATADGQVLTRVSGALAWATPTAYATEKKTVTTYTSGSGNFTVPAGITRLRVVLIGGGGSGGSSSSSAAIGSSGASLLLLGTGGGSGAMIILEMDVTPAEDIAYVVGAGGSGVAATSAGNPGGASTVTASAGTASAGGGGGGTTSSTLGPGAAGEPTSNVGAARNPVNSGWFGRQGSQRVGIGSNYWGEADPAFGFAFQGTEYGNGSFGKSSGTTDAGGGGLVAFIY